jgi:methylated-DNA-[protein]-cysteine S-methyltransferase
MMIFYYQTAIGQTGIAERDGQITHLFLPNDTWPHDFRVCETPLLKTAADQLQSYLQGDLRAFSLPLAPAGTLFMQQVWACLGKIRYGQSPQPYPYLHTLPSCGRRQRLSYRIPRRIGVETTFTGY